MSLPRFPEFRLISLDDRKCIQAFLEKHPSPVCELSFANIFIWRNFEHTKLTIINNNLCLLSEPPSEPAYFLQPVGSNKIPETIRICLSFTPRLSRIPEDFVKAFCSGYRTEADRNNFDYVYLAEDLIKLSGKKYDGKRNRIRKFERSHGYRYLRLEPGLLDGCRALVRSWAAEKMKNGDLVRPQEEAILEALAHYETLGLSGAVIDVNGRIEAFSIGEKFTSDTAVIHIEIVNSEFDGLSQFINKEFVKNEFAGVRFVNREQDIGLPGLRRAKLSYHPHHFVSKYNVWG